MSGIFFVLFIIAIGLIDVILCFAVYNLIRYGDLDGKKGGK